MPKTVANFVDICDGVTELSPPNPQGRKRSYDGTEMFRVIPDFMAQGGDIRHPELIEDGEGGLKPRPPGTDGESIYPGNEFPDENFRISHSREFVLSMANNGPNTNTS